MLNKKTLVELIRYCTVFEQEEKKDEKTGLIFQVKIKKVAAYHQYYAVQKAVTQTIRATMLKKATEKLVWFGIRKVLVSHYQWCFIVDKL